ncbi:hypothetical protein GHT06_017072 [Daphnia sinensis]|uniref:Uncharacterized protein n=1 Tax=Daphnia sinensis TaxID=1820382 RepID=A0AAD5PUM1_9CRUS|nr:hypothetical protein GHT06_017072 [Daphnia sinensis]
MRLLVYWWTFVVTLVSVQCRNPVNSLLSKRIRPFTSQHTQSQSTNETSTQQTLNTTSTEATPPTHSASTVGVETLTSLIHPSTPSTVKVIPAVAATTNLSANGVTLSKNSSTVAVKSMKEDTLRRSTLDAVWDKADNVSFGITQAATNNQDRFVMGNNATRSTNPFNATQLFPKRPLRSQTINRYLAKAKEKALGSSTASPILDKPTHVIVKRHFIPLMSLDDFVLDTDDV